jgi:hypothetical protein
LATARRFRSGLLKLVDDLAAGSLDLQGFTRRSRSLVRSALGTAFALGALSVDPFHTLTTRDITVINDEIDTQRRFLRQFAKDVERGFYTLDPYQRASLYLAALRGMFELGRVEAGPAGPFIWKLGDTEHCMPCFAASTAGPYQRTPYSHLGLPVLPGIPGSGDICNGLTRCGCTVVMADGIPLPNAGLPQRLREDLHALVLEGG